MDQVDLASPNKSPPRRQRSSRWEAVLLGGVLLVVGFVAGRQTLQSGTADLILAGAGFDPAKWPLRGGGSGRTTSWRAASPLPPGGSVLAPKAYYLPTDLGVHHYTLSGARGSRVRGHHGLLRCPNLRTGCSSCKRRVMPCRSLRTADAPLAAPRHHSVCNRVGHAGLGAGTWTAHRAHTWTQLQSLCWPASCTNRRFCACQGRAERVLQTSSTCDFAGQLGNGTAVLHVWLVMTRQRATDGGNGTITLQGYGFFQSIEPIMVYPGGEVLVCFAPACQAPSPL